MLIDEQLEALADEAERGYNPAKITPVTRALSPEPEPCPDCDHEPEDHDTRGCRGYNPQWPRLVRCECKQGEVHDVD